MNENLFFYASKIIWMLIVPSNFLLLLLLAGLLLRRVSQCLSRFCIIVSVFLFIALGFLPVGDLMLKQLEQSIPATTLPDQIDGIVVLGGFLDQVATDYYNQPVMNDASERWYGLVELSKHYQKAKLVFTGGSGDLLAQEKREGDVVVTLWHDAGGDPKRLLIERDSRNTSENAVFTKSFVQPAPDKTWLLVTSAFHMKRALAIFQKEGWNVIPYPVDYRASPRIKFFPIQLSENLRKTDIAMKEWIGLLAYRLSGKAQ